MISGNSVIIISGEAQVIVNKRSFLLGLAAVILLITASLSVVGCERSGYETFTLERGIGHFSVEYPASYDIARVEVRNDEEHIYTSVAFISPYLKKKQVYNAISIFVDTKSDSFPNAEAAMEFSLSSHEKWEDFKLLDRGSITVNGIQAQQIIYSYTVLRDPMYFKDTQVSATEREVYFDYGGLIWEISISSNTSTAEAANVHFEHILQTFKILN